MKSTNAANSCCRLFSGVCATGLWLLAQGIACGQQPAFPGAEGFGSFALGGRSGTVYHVTNLSDSGSGSFRDAVSQPNRTIVFDLSGTINLASNLTITRSNLTIAGQTAPGDGITIKGWLTSVQNTRNVIVRYIRCRPGDINCPTFQDDAFHFDTASNCIADHVSGSWDNDEVLSATHCTNVTVQWCMIAEPLDFSCHDEGSGIQHHGYGSLLRYGGGGLSFHHNLYAHNKSRNPRLGDNIHLDWVNNVIYNWGDTCGYNADDSGDSGVFTQFLNYVNNYLIIGTNTTQSPPRAFKGDTSINRGQCQIYQSGNLIDTNKTGSLAGFDKGWASFSGNFTTNLTRLPFPQVTADSAGGAYVRVLSSVGATIVRDAVDAGVVSNVLTRTGHIINSQTEVGGWPTLNSLPAPLDTDQDGLPDFWEIAMGSNTNNAADRNDLMPDGYTRLEWYLNWLSGPHVRATDSFVDVELKQYTAGLPSATYGAFSASNGTVNLLGDGHTARFTPILSFTGLASFAFTAAGSPANLTGTVSVLVTPSTIATAPQAAFTASPISGTEPLTVNITDTSTGTSPLSLFWNLGDSTTTNTAGGAGFGHLYAAGTYTVTLTASNSAGTSTLVSNNLITIVTAFQAWQSQYFSCTNCPQADANADPDGDGQNNQAEFLSGTNPTNNLSGLRIISAVQETNDVRITWMAAGGRTNVVQATAGDITGSYQTNFADVSGPIVIFGSGDTITNYLDSGGGTNVPSKFYRIRLQP